MSQSRVYTVQFGNVTLSAVQDLFAIFAGANMAFEVHYIKVGQVTQTTIGGLRLRGRRLPATVTAGSGGSTPTPQPLNPSDAAATVTAHANDTVQASSSGTIVDLIADTWDLPFGYLWVPPESDRPIIKPSQAFVLSLDTVPAGLVANGHIAVRELF